MASYNMLFAGFGGQGVLFTGKVTSHAALIDGYDVSWLPSYGPEMRGGTANCSVCIARETIGSPVVTEPDVLMVFNAPSYEKFIQAVLPKGTVFIDSSLIKTKCPRNDINIFSLPATQLSVDKNLEGMANIIMLGKLLKEIPFTTLGTVEKALRKSIPEKKIHLLDANMRALTVGLSC